MKDVAPPCGSGLLSERGTSIEYAYISLKGVSFQTKRIDRTLRAMVRR